MNLEKLPVAGEHLLFVGVGGMGMAPLAVYAREAGFRVSGWDDHLSPAVELMLREAGVELPAAPELPAGLDGLVFSSAVRPTHPLRAAAASACLPQSRRGEFLARLARSKKLIAVCGSHGKTTTTAMAIQCLRAAGTDPSYVLGALFADGSPSARHTDSPWLVAEVDESDGTIEHFAPAVTVCVNLDWDHPDQYPQPEALDAAFRRLFLRTGELILVPDHQPQLIRLVDDRASARLRTFGLGGAFAGRRGRIAEGRQRLALEGDFPPEEVEVSALGAFNARNAVAALAVAYAVAGKVPAGALARFPGVRRRQARLLDQPGLAVFEDYSHHPTELAAVLEASREAFPDRRTVAVFQPHRYTRTAQYAADFARALAGADALALLDTYAAGEEFRPDGGVRAIADAPELAGRAARPADDEALDAWLGGQLQGREVVWFFGAGDIDGWAARWVARRRSRLASNPFAALALHPETVLREREPLAAKTTWGVGGPARWYAEPASVADLAALITAAGAARLPWFLFGRGSNLLVPDEGYAGLVIAFNHRHWQELEECAGGRLRAGAGVKLKRLCAFAAAAGLGGLEFLEGIPGTVGGSLRMNAGAMGGWIFDLVESVEAVLADGTVRTYRRDELHPGYRSCPELAAAVATAAVFRAPERRAPEEIRARMAELASRRKATQPREASAGCVFKNPPGDHAGRLIDAAGLKGEAVGGAEVSPVHANFIVNRDGATCADIVGLMRRVRAGVRARAGVELQPEVMLLGQTWEEVL